MSDQRRNALIVGGVPLAFLLVLYVAWGISSLANGDQVGRNVTVADIQLGGLDQADLGAVASDLDDGLVQQAATLKAGDLLLDTNLFEVGVRVDAEQLTNDALAAREGGNIVLRPFAWLGSFFNTVEVPVSYVVDDNDASQAAQAIVEGQLSQPTDPYFETTGEGLTVVPGIDGTTIAFDRVGDNVREALDLGEPYVIQVEPLPLAPSVETAKLQAVADEANVATAAPVLITLLGEETTVEPNLLRSWIVLDNEQVTWSFDNAAIVRDLRPMFPDLGTEDERAHFNVVDGKPVIVPGTQSVLCCDVDSADRLMAALLGPGSERSVELAPEIVDGGAGVAQLETLGIIEEVSTFTTNHACCQNRVKNIQRMADIVQGYVVRPGELFDLNAIVGKRTREGGFLPAGAIADGVLEDQVGGGVSQFTTTMFNAAFFAGMEFVEYQAHSIYFSRYPRGREATISFPKPDFIVRNDTDYGILVWPTWTDTSITVTLYSTKNIVVEDLGRTETAQSECTRVTTTRQRTFADGDVKKDTVFAVYRPAEGLDCNGNSTVPTTQPPATTTTETTLDPNATSSTTAAPTTGSTAAPTTVPPPPPTESTPTVATTVPAG